MEFRSGDALLVFDDDLNIVSWNQAAEELTGVPSDEAVGRPCWEVLGGLDEQGALVCHRGCSGARLVRKGWPVGPQHLLVKTAGGRRKVAVSTIAVDNESSPLYLHVLRNGIELAAEEDGEAKPSGRRPTLTPRQLEVLGLIAAGMPAKAIAEALEIAEPTVRNHIRAILLQLGAHSQLAAVASARRWGLIE
jgi:PAS domain S-box-containing protein